jgi:alpha-glucoside transport system substrate-binding protein
MLVVLALVAAACGGDGDDGGEVSVFGAPTGIEAEGMQQVIDDEINANRDYTATYEGSDSFEEQIKIRVEGGNPPDVALYPQPGALVEQAEAGELISLEDLGFTRSELEATFGKYLLSLGEVDGKYYGLPTNVNMKSFVWYPLPAFTDAGYTPPTTWDELIALSDKMVADGNTPWCIGTGSDANTGWPATDWIEDIMLRTAGSDAYDRWVTNDLKFSSPEVTRAAQLLGDIAFGEGYVLGGSQNIPDIDFRDAPDPMFQDPPACYMHRQASFITTFFDAPDGRDLVGNVDYGVFAFPDIDPGVKGALGAGELAAVFTDNDDVRDWLETYTGKDVQCAQGLLEGVGRISPNLEVGPDCYSNPILATAAGTIVDALANEGFRFDASDLMPSSVGSGTFWTAMNDYMRGGPDALDQALADVDASWP